MPRRRTKPTAKKSAAKKTTAKKTTAKRATAAARTRAEAPPSKQPNILVIWGDDIGISNLSCYSDGLMGYRTPNIDRVAAEGVRFTDSYGEQSCTAGRSAFITGQSVYRTGMSKVGIPSSPVGIQPEDPTIAELLKPLGYATGQFGKNHLGDRDEFLPTNHGFDEFFGNLYHLNAEEEPENADFPDPKEFPEFNRLYHPRGVIHSWAKPTARSGSRTPVRSRGSAWRRRTTSSWRQRRTSSVANTRRASHSSSG
jgi:arylsulfatase